MNKLKNIIDKTKTWLHENGLELSSGKSVILTSELHERLFNFK